VRDLPPFPHEMNPAVPLALSDLILRMMSKEPIDRPENCAAVRQGLQSVLQNLSAKASAPSFARLAENATKYFELDMEANEAQWQKIKQSPLLKKIQKPKVMIGASVVVVFLGLLMWFGLSDDTTSDNITNNQQAHENKIPRVHPLPVTPLKPTLAIPADVKQPPKKGEKPGKTFDVKKNEPVKQASKPLVTKTVAITKVKPVIKHVVKKSVKKRPQKMVGKDILDRVAYKLRRQHGESIDIHQPHEFHGGNHLYFKDLSFTKEKTFFTKFKKDELRLYFYEPVHLKAIVVEQASVKGALFEGGRIKLEAQDEHFKWNTLIKKSDHDISKPIRISETSLPSLVKSVSVRLNSSSPLTLGPIRLLE